MRPLLRFPIVRFMRRRQLLFPLVLVLIAAGVLFQGALDYEAAPPPDPRAPVPGAVPVEPARAVVRADLEKTPLTYFADYWAQLAERSQVHLTSVGAAGPPAIAVGTRLVLTSAEPAAALLAAERRERLVGSGGANGGALEAGPFRLRGWDPDVGLALFEVTGDALMPFTLTDARVLPSGSYVGAVTLTPEGEPAVTPGYFVAVRQGHDGLAGDLVVSMNLAAIPELAAVVNLDGALLGVVHATPDGPRVTTSTTMLRLIEGFDVEDVCRGLEVADLDDAVRERFVIERGVLIEYVDPHAFHPEPSLRGGDILLEWGEEDVTSAEQFRELYDAGTPGDLVRYRVLRNRRRIAGGTLLPDTECRPVSQGPVRFASSGVAFEWLEPEAGASGPGGWQVIAVRPGGPAARAGVAEGDLLVALEGAATDAEDDRAALEAASERTAPMLLSLRRGARMKLAVVQPEEPPAPDAGNEGER